MKLDHLPEPELEFGGGRHVDIRFGLMTYGPLDYASELAPRQIRLGFVGTPQTIESLAAWLARCRDGVAAKQSRQPNLFPRFPGFGPDTCFHTSLVFDDRLQRSIPQRQFDRLAQCRSANLVIDEAVRLFAAEVKYLAQNTSADVIMCALPMGLLDLIDSKRQEESDRNSGTEGLRLDLHDLLKARVMATSRPIQVIRPATYDPALRKRLKSNPLRTRQLQDEATIAWNIHTALYYKAGGTPWRLARQATQLTACHIGVGFYKTLDNAALQTSVAQVFNERGDGIIVRGEQVAVSKEDLHPHLSEEAACQLLSQALERYRQEHWTLPARAVVHKTSLYTPEERDGFQAAITQHGVSSCDLISISSSYTRLFRSAAYPPLRGTFWSLDDHTHVLYARGSVDFFSTYPGMYVPVPLRLRCELVEQTPKFLAAEILALTKMNWNNTEFDGGEPITLRAADQVGNTLKYVGANDPVAPRYSFYM